jgi:general secretion pathway protein M
MNPSLDFKARWTMLSQRDRTVLQLGATVVGLALFWWLVLAPAITTLHGAAQQHQRLDTQLQRMQILQAQVQALQKRPQVSTADAARALEQSVRQQLGASAQLQVNGAQATVSLQNLSADKLAQWLPQARLNAHATVTQARLKRNAAAGPATWSGTLVLRLPER